MTRRGLGALLALSSLAAFRAVGQQPVKRFPVPEPRYEVRAVKSVLLATRDGVKLSTDLYFPDGADGRLPVLLYRTPYGKGRSWTVAPALRFVHHGYVVAIQDIRGKFESGGAYAMTGPDRNDGYDTIDWLSRQPWSNGRVGTIGCSYLGETQITAATTRHPAHAAMVPQAASNVIELATAFKGGTVRGGAVELSSSADWLRTHGSKVRPVLLPNEDSARFRAAVGAFRLDPSPPETDFVGLLRSLPLVRILDRMNAPPTDWEAFVTSPPSGPIGRRYGFVQPDDRFDTPALLVDSWYDYGPANTLRLVNHLAKQAESELARRNVFAVIGPTTHCAYERASEHTIVGRRDVGDARFDFFGLYLRWFDRWLLNRPNEIDGLPRLYLYVMGRAEWRGENEWPLARTRWTRYYLRSDGKANSRYGTGSLSVVAPGRDPPDSLVYDPASPVPSMGGPDFGANNPELPPGALDQSAVEIRNDVLVYTTPPLEQGVEVTGPIRLELFVSSDGPDTDFTGKLVDVYPDGTAYNVQEGILRMRYREGWDRAIPMVPGTVYRVEIDLEVTSNYFRPGHRIRLEVSSSNFPRFDRNLNTGGTNYDETTWRVARNVVHHSARHPSALVLPIIP